MNNIELIEQAALEYEQTFGFHTDGKISASHSDAFRAAVEFATKMHPISETPKVNSIGESNTILMRIDHFYYTGYYINGRWFESITGEEYTPTHWLELEGYIQ